MRRILVGYVGSLLLCGVVFAQAPDPLRTPIIENDRVRVWLNAAPVNKLPADAVSVFITPSSAGANYLPQKGASTLVIGGAMLPGGNPESAPRDTVSTLYVELKDKQILPQANTTGLPNAFPRPGSRQLLDNARVTVWEYRWTPGEATPMHFHDKDVVVLFLEEGSLVSTTPTGEKTQNDYMPGTVRFNARDRVHTETLVKGSQRAVMVELK